MTRAPFVSILSILVFAVTTTACSTFLPPVPKTGAEATGQPLALRESMITESEHYKEHVGTISDEDGHTLANIYEEGTITHHIPVWYGYQGADYIDAEDFFRIAGDPQNAARVHDRRRLAYVANRGGWIASAAGVALMFVAGALPDSGFRTGVSLVGLGGMAIGVPCALWGMKMLSPERHGVDSMSAAMAAEQYNQHLHDRGASSTTGGLRVGMAWNF